MAKFAVLPSNTLSAVEFNQIKVPQIKNLVVKQQVGEIKTEKQIK